jgi:hypothetical protein
MTVSPVCQFFPDCAARHSADRLAGANAGRAEQAVEKACRTA